MSGSEPLVCLWTTVFKQKQKDAREIAEWLFPCKRSCFSHLDSLWAIPTLFRVQSLPMACVLGLYPLSSSFPPQTLLPPSALSRPDPKCSACCSAVQSPESSPSSLRAICSICLCPAHLASYPQRGPQDLVSEPLLPPVLPLVAL